MELQSPRAAEARAVQQRRADAPRRATRSRQAGGRRPHAYEPAAAAVHRPVRHAAGRYAVSVDATPTTTGSRRAGTPVEIVPGFKTRIWGYNGSLPGPTITSSRAARSVVRKLQPLPAIHPTLGYTPWTSVHLHGSASLPQFDGYASDVTYPGQYKDYQYPNFQDAADPLVPRPRRAPHRPERVHRAGRRSTTCTTRSSESLPIPQGELRRAADRQRRDVRQGRASCSSTTTTDHSGLCGDVILVNGRPWPVMQVERRKYRFRILNASISRSYRWRSAPATR